ncbi:MAG TPA: hypothetical protein VGJ69_04775 [Pyrinomonadaceae bacterium]|jgi:hypothetical protein
MNSRNKSKGNFAAICGFVFLFAGAVIVANGQDDRKPTPESPRTESPRTEAPGPPAESPRSEPAPSSPSSSGSSSSNNDSSRNDTGSRSSDDDSGRRNRDNDSGRRNNDAGGRNNRDAGSGRPNENPRSGNNEAGTRIRGTMDGDGSAKRRDQIIEKESGDPIAPQPPPLSGPGGANPGGGNPRGNPSGGNPGGDRDRDRDGDRHRGRHGHRHRHTDDCYRVPTYDDTISYSSGNYQDYDDSLSAYDLGYNDGVYTGASDARRGQTYDPERSHFYQEAKHGYRNSKGSRDAYQQAYRDGFLHGYREGFQNWQVYFSGGRFHR